MSLTRRSFLKALSAGGITLAFPEIAKSATIDNPHGFSVEDAEKLKRDFLNNSITITLTQGPSRSDPLGQRSTIGWEARGSDGNQYENYIETTAFGQGDNYNHINNIAQEVAKIVKKDFSDIPALSNIRLPEWNEIALKIKTQLNTG